MDMNLVTFMHAAKGHRDRTASLQRAAQLASNKAFGKYQRGPEKVAFKNRSDLEHAEMHEKAAKAYDAVADHEIGGNPENHDEAVHNAKVHRDKAAEHRAKAGEGGGHHGIGPNGPY
jgi:hypothetical protein